jgi:hypothetical protein
MSPVVIAPVVIARSGSDEAIPYRGLNRIAAHALGLDPGLTRGSLSLLAMTTQG